MQNKIIQWSKKVLLFLGLIIISFVLLRAIAEPYRYTGSCMMPALKEGKLYFLNRLAPYFRAYSIGDIVLFKYESKDWVARIVALEHDTIQINENSILVNDIALQESHILRNWSDWKYGTFALENPLKIPARHVYVLSDDLAAHHDDSRVFGPIPISSLLGVLW